MWRRFKLLGAAAIAAVLMTSSAQAATSLDLAAVPEPATMMLLGIGLLAAFKARREA
jgi:hypothetical protein